MMILAVFVIVLVQSPVFLNPMSTFMLVLVIAIGSHYFGMKRTLCPSLIACMQSFMWIGRVVKAFHAYFACFVFSTAL